MIESPAAGDKNCAPVGSEADYGFCHGVSAVSMLKKELKKTSA
jgi:hypothetical protein